MHTSGSIVVNQTKFITQNNVAVANLSITNNGSASTTLHAARHLALRHLGHAATN